MKDFSIDAIWNILLALGAGTGLVFMLRWFWWRINAWSEIVAMIASLVFFLLIGVKEKQNALEVLIVDRDQTKIMLVAFASIACWVIATFLTKPESMDKLVSFYKKIGPGGPGWKPVAEKCPGVQVDQNLGLSIVASFVAAGFIYSVLPMTGFVIFGDYQSALLSGIAALICGGVTLVLVRKLTR